jgi:hypothetical protein
MHERMDETLTQTLTATSILTHTPTTQSHLLLLLLYLFNLDWMKHDFGAVCLTLGCRS